MIDVNRIEFNLTIKKYGHKPRQPYDYERKEDEKPELVEELTFNSMSTKEVIRKLIDYIEY